MQDTRIIPEINRNENELQIAKQILQLSACPKEMHFVCSLHQKGPEASFIGYETMNTVIFHTRYFGATDF